MDTKLYEFWTLGGRLLDTVETNDPSYEACYQASMHGVPPDEVCFEEFIAEEAQ